MDKGQHKNPFTVAPQDGKRGRIHWESEDEMKAWPRMPFNAAIALAENKALSTNQLIPALHVVPVRCYTSPIVSMFTYDPKTPWIPLVKTTLVVIWELMQIRLWFDAKSAALTKSKDKRGVALGKRLQQYLNVDFPAWEKKQDTQLDTFFCAMKDQGIHSMKLGKKSQQCMDDFASLMKRQTYALIDILEHLVYDCGVIYAHGAKLRFVASSTSDVPVDYPYADEKQQAEETVNMQNFFQTKQSYLIAYDRVDQNGKMKETHTDIIHIDHGAIFKIMNERRGDASQVYQRYIPYYTLWQYAMLLDYRGNRILGVQSKGVPLVKK